MITILKYIMVNDGMGGKTAQLQGNNEDIDNTTVDTALQQRLLKALLNNIEMAHIIYEEITA